MEINEAIRLLGIRRGEGGEALQKRYHERLHLYHPDVAGEREGTRQTQLLNEAYTLLKERQKQGWDLEEESLQKNPPGEPPFPKEETALRGFQGHWMARENQAAYLPRKIFMADDLFGDDIVVDTRYRGKYYWQRESEPFPLFLKSVNESALELCKNQGQPAVLVPKLFHLLLQEYIHPLDTLKAFAGTSLEEAFPESPSRRASTSRAQKAHKQINRSYQLPCHLKSCDKAAAPRQGETYSLRVSDNRIFCLGRDHSPLAQVTFSEDALYYVVTPLLLQEAALGSLIPSSRGNARLSLTLTGKPYQDPTQAINREIDRLLKG